MTQAPLLSGRRRRLLAWVAAARRVVGEGREVVVTAVVVVVVAAAVVVGAALGAVVELVGWPVYWKKEQPASFSSFEHSRPSLGRANSYSDPSRFRLPSLQKRK